MVTRYKIATGFTLIELLMVMGILTVILSTILFAVNPAEQISKAADASSKVVIKDVINSAIGYYSSQKKLPWDVNPDCRNQLNAGVPLTDIPDCIHELIKDPKFEEAYLSAPELKEIHITRCGNSAVLCYNPKSKTENLNAETKYNKFGVNDPGCPGTHIISPDCYWCRPLMKSEDCLIVPTHTPAPTPTRTPTPTPANPWGEAAVFGRQGCRS